MNTHIGGTGTAQSGDRINMNFGHFDRVADRVQQLLHQHRVSIPTRRSHTVSGCAASNHRRSVGHDADDATLRREQLYLCVSIILKNLESKKEKIKDKQFLDYIFDVTNRNSQRDRNEEMFAPERRRNLGCDFADVNRLHRHKQNVVVLRHFRVIICDFDSQILQKSIKVDVCVCVSRNYLALLLTFQVLFWTTGGNLFGFIFS